MQGGGPQQVSIIKGVVGQHLARVIPKPAPERGRHPGRGQAVGLDAGQVAAAQTELAHAVSVVQSVAQKGAIQVADAAELERTLRRLLDDPQLSGVSAVPMPQSIGTVTEGWMAICWTGTWAG